MSAVILGTGARAWTDRRAIGRGLSEGIRRVAMPGMTLSDITLRHGAAAGADELLAACAMAWGLMLDPIPATDFPDPLARNLYMIGQGADVCIAFARASRSGTGHCARAARRAGILTIDFGVETEARPDAQ